MSQRKVYIDTNVFKFSATQLPRLRPRQQTINWGGKVHEITVHDFVTLNPNEAIDNPKLKAEADLLPALAELGKQGRVRYVTNVETLFESWGIPSMDSSTGKFYGAPCEMVDAPIKYGRIMFGGGVDDPMDAQFEFLRSIRNDRFLELQKMVGAYQGENKPNRNQLLDAFHLWCAEHNKCDFFLTLDFKLIRVLRNNRKRALGVEVFKPSELLGKLGVGT
ncbi:MAG: hypothetical protein ACE5KK_04680 [Candidatus Brocadiales bacterium]